MFCRFIVVLFGLYLSSITTFGGALTPEDLNSPQLDGCTSSPNGNWGHCCHEHDILYWRGGSFHERKAADERLKWCMNESTGLVNPSQIYFDFVRAAGVEFWSAAWPNRNRSQNLSEEDLEKIGAERDLWVSLGGPMPYDFIVYESTVFMSFNESDLILIEDKFLPFSETPTYQNFLQIYRERLGEDPLTENIGNINLLGPVANSSSFYAF